MTIRVYSPRPPAPAFEQTVRELLDAGVELAFGPETPEPADWRVLFDSRPSRSMLLKSPKLRAVVVPHAGVPEQTRELVRKLPGVSLHNLHHNAAPAAEMAVALMLAASKRLIPADRRLRTHDWRHPEDVMPSLLLEGRTALVVGFGSVGRRVARACRALGMRVSAVRRTLRAVQRVDGVDVHPRVMLRALLPAANVVHVCVPGTPANHGLFGARELALLPPDAVLVNVARGVVIDECALFEGLQRGRPAAAGLDVWWRYPEDAASCAATPPSRFPFGELDNVILGPHRAGRSDETEALRGAHLAVLLNVAARGQRMHNLVDLELGY